MLLAQKKKKVIIQMKTVLRFNMKVLQVKMEAEKVAVLLVR